MFKRADKVTEAARLFNDAMDKLIQLSDEIHPDEDMLKIAKRKLLWARRVDALLPVQLTWDNRLLTEHGKYIIARDESYFKRTSHQDVVEFVGTRNDFNAADISQLLDKFRGEWESTYSDQTKDAIWKYTQQLYQAYLNYGFAMKTKQ